MLNRVDDLNEKLNLYAPIGWTLLMNAERSNRHFKGKRKWMTGHNIGGTPIMTALFIDNKRAVEKILDYYGDELDFDACVSRPSLDARNTYDIMYYTSVYLSDKTLRARIQELYDKFEAKK